MSRAVIALVGGSEEQQVTSQNSNCVIYGGTQEMMALEGRTLSEIVLGCSGVPLSLGLQSRVSILGFSPGLGGEVWSPGSDTWVFRGVFGASPRS